MKIIGCQGIPKGLTKYFLFFYGVLWTKSQPTLFRLKGDFCDNRVDGFVSDTVNENGIA